MKVIFRNFFMTLRRFKLASILNVLGLSVAFAAFMIIMIQVRYEQTFDCVYEKSGRIYRVESTLIPTEANLSSRGSYTAFCARPLMEMMLGSVSHIESYVIMHDAPSDMYVKYETGEGERMGMRIPYREVSEGITEVFDMEMVEGSAASLSEPGKALIPESLALTMFGKESAVNKQFTQPDGTFFTVGGVYRDYPENTSIVNDVKIGMGDKFKNDWMDWAFLLFVTLAQDTSADDVSGQLTDFFHKTGMGKQMGFPDDVSFRLNLIEDIYYCQDTTLDIAPKGNRTTTTVLFAIALLVVGIAAANFLNFSTALTPARIKSINTRKILGESTAILRLALVFEALGICLISFLFALCWVIIFDATGLSSMLLSSVNLLANKDVFFLTFLFSVGIGIIAGIYPALYMTSFRPALVLKGSFGMSPAGRKLRVILTGFQFVISIGLVISVLFVWLQNRYMYNREGILNTSRIVAVTIDREVMSKHADVLIERLKSASAVSEVAYSDWPIGFHDNYAYTYSKLPDDEEIMYYYLPVSYRFINVMGLKITEGRNFEYTDVTAGDDRLIINELAARKYNLKPGDKLTSGSIKLTNGGVIIGIVEDFHFMSLRKKIEPMALTVKSFQNAVLHPTLYICTSGNVDDAIDQIKTEIVGIDPLYPVDVMVYDRQFENAYSKERKTSMQITLFSILAIVISVMGVFGLVTFETQYRQKEISIRRVMGAGILEVLLLFNKKFIRIVLVCFLVAQPIAWYGVEQWMQSFAYRIPLDGWVFALSLLVVMLITIVTVTVQSWQIATSDPVRFLKNE